MPPAEVSFALFKKHFFDWCGLKPPAHTYKLLNHFPFFARCASVIGSGRRNDTNVSAGLERLWAFTRFSRHPPLVVSSCSNHEVVVELFVMWGLTIARLECHRSGADQPSIQSNIAEASSTRSVQTCQSSGFRCTVSTIPEFQSFLATRVAVFQEIRSGF